MIVYLSLTVVVVMLSLLVRKRQTEYGPQMVVYKGMTRQQMVNRICILSIFVLLFVVSAMRLNVGNDYLKYVEYMHLALYHAYIPTEVGFNVLAYVLYTICGFENYLLVFAVYSFATIYFFMKALYEESEWFTFSFILFMMLGYYFQSLSTVRYYLALSMALYSIKFVIKKDWPKFFLIVLIGSLFHKSMLVVLVLYIVASLNWKRWMYIALGLCSVSCLFFSDLYLKIVVFLYPSYKDTEYLTGGTSYVNILRCLAVLGLSLWLYQDVVKKSRRNRFYFICNLMALMLYVFGSFLPVISRIGYYLTITHVLFLPTLVMGIKDYKKKQLAVLAIAVCSLAYFALYMRGAAADGVRILPYQTFLFHDLPLTLSERGYY